MASHLAHGPTIGRWPLRRRYESPARGRERGVRSSAPRAASPHLDAAHRPLGTSEARPRSWVREIALVSVLYLAYTSSRLLSLAPPDAAGRNAQRVLDLERTLHIAPEHALNDLLFSAPRWLSVFSAYYYETLHYAMTAGTLIWLYRSSPVAYRRARNWLVSMTLPALIAFWLFPVAPPRTVPGAATHDIVAEQHNYGWWGAGGGTAPRGLAGLVNENAAMPSLHVGWALWVGWNLVHSSRNPFVRAFGYVYPVLTIFVVLSTGNHYLLDVLAGALLAFVAKIAVDKAGAHFRSPTRPAIGLQPGPAIGRSDRDLIPRPSSPAVAVPQRTGSRTGDHGWKASPVLTTPASQTRPSRLGRGRRPERVGGVQK